LCCSDRKAPISEKIETNSVLHDSLFYSLNIESLNSQNIDSIKNLAGLKKYKVPEGFKKSLRTIIGLDSDRFNAYFLSKHYEDTSFASISLYVNSIKGDELYFINLSKDLNILSHIVLTEIGCDVVNQYEDKEVVWCERYGIEFNSDNSLLYFKIIDEEVSIEGQSQSYQDSIFTLYPFNSNGLLVDGQKDSLRLK